MHDASIAVIPAGYRALLADLVDMAVRLLARGGSVPCSYYIGCSDKRVLQELPIDSGSAQTKHMSATLAQAQAVVLDADFVIVTSESWAMPSEQVHLMDAVLAQYGSVAAYPERVDVAWFYLETREGLFTGTAPISQPLPTRNRRTMGKVTWLRGDVATGTLTGILPKRPRTS